MSIPPNQFRRDHSWTRFVLLDSSVGPVPSQAKVLIVNAPYAPYAALPIRCKVYYQKSFFDNFVFKEINGFNPLDNPLDKYCGQHCQVG